MAFRDPAPIKLTEVKKEVVRLDDDKQGKNSSNLTTKSKNIEGAINELKTKSDTLTSNSALKSTQIIAGNGLQGGGTLEQNRTLSIKGANDSITASSSGLAVNTYNGINSTSTTRPVSANALKTTYDKLVTVENTANSKLSKAGDTMSGNISFSNQGTSFVGLKGSVGDDDGWRIAGGSKVGNVGELEIATGFSGNQPIYVRQYNGTNYSTIARTLTLLDASGNTTFPGTLTASKISGALTGNASTATSLQTARTINGTSFNGTANITTANWGTARTLTIGNTGKSVNGSTNVSWSLSEIGAFGKQGEVTSSTNWNNLRTPGVYKVQMNAWGDVSLGAPNNTFSSLYTYGILHVYQSNISAEERTTQVYYPHSSTNSHPIVTRMYNGSTWNSWSKLGRGLTYTDVGAAASSHTHSYLPLAGGTMTGNIKYTLYSSTQTPLEIYGGDANGQGIKIGAGGSTIISSGEGKNQIASNIAATTETTAIGSDQTIEFYTNLQNGWGSRKTMLMGANGVLTNSNGFSGPLTGNASTATTLQTARTINGTSFNGSANITTANWGTARTLTIGASSQSINGSANYTYSHSAMQVGRAYSRSYNYGGNQNAITTAAFITILTNLGAFSQPYWCARGSWSYASNQYINDTGCGNIHLAGCTVEVMGSSSAYTVRIHTPTTSSSGVTNGDFIYVNNGTSYSPGWRRLYNTKYKPSAADVGALATSGGTISGNLTVSGKLTVNGGIAGTLTGNSTTATTLQTARTLTIGNTGKSFNGSANISWSLSEIGALSSTTSATWNATGTASGQGLTFNGKTVAGGTSDVWLRLNPHNQFSSGIYCGSTGVLRHDSEVGVGSSGADGTSRMKNNVYDSTWGGNGVAHFMAHDTDSTGAHWLIASYYDASNIRSGIQVLTSSTGDMRFYTNRRSNYVTISGGNVLAGSGQNTSANALTRKDYVDGALGKKLNTTGGTISGNLTVTGAIVANGNVTAYSDRKLKSNIVKIENALDKICSIGGYTFDMLGTGQRQTGVIAQELEKVLPEAVIKNDNGYLSVDYGRVVGLLIEGIKELKEEIQELKGGK